MFSAPGHVFGGTEGVGSRFQVLRSRTLFQRYRGRRVLFSRFALPDNFSAVRRHRDPFSRFALPDSFSAVPGTLGPIFLFCAPGLIFDGTEGVESLFHVFGSRTYFRRYRGRRVPFSCSTLLESFSVVSRSSGLVFMFCAPRLVFGGTKGLGSRFHVLRSRICFRRYRGRRVPFPRFARPDSFSAVQRASGPVFMFCAHGLVFGRIKGVRSRFHVLCTWTRFRRYRVRRVPFS
jgi:hypothetical protein